MLRRVQQAGTALSMSRLLSELDGIREVINVYPRKRRQKEPRQQSVYSKLSEVQARLLEILELDGPEEQVLG